MQRQLAITAQRLPKKVKFIGTNAPEAGCSAGSMSPMPWWEEALDLIGLSRMRINTFVIIVGLAGIAVLSFAWRGVGAWAALASIAAGIVLAVLSLVLQRRPRRSPSWLLCFAALVVAIAGAVLSVRFLGVHSYR